LKGRDDFCKGQQRGSLNFPQRIEKYEKSGACPRVLPC
jgi:hypothetical protein